MIIIKEDGEVFSRKEYLPIYKKKFIKYNDYDSESSSSDHETFSDSH